MAKKKGPGKPKANIDWKQVDQYLNAQCDGVEIAGLLGINPETLYNRCKTDNKIGFSEYSAKKRYKGKGMIRVKQFDTMMKGCKTMLVWLGKQYLDQKEKTENSNTNKNTEMNVNYDFDNDVEPPKDDY